MKSHLSALALGLSAGIAAFVLVDFHFAGLAGHLAAGRADLVQVLSERLTASVWAAAAAAAAFALVMLAVAAAAGIAESLATRSKARRLHDALAASGGGTVADWRAVFAGTAMTDWADAAVTGVSGDPGGPALAFDAGLLTRLEDIWLDRLVLARVIAPLPILSLGLGATLALFRYGAGPGWEIVLAGGMAGALAIGAFLYLARMAVGPAVAGAARSVIALASPIAGASPPIAGSRPTASPAPFEASPGTADGAGLFQDGIDPALREVRAGIERLLARPAKDE
jgi:hypothetical protein